MTTEQTKVCKMRLCIRIIAIIIISFIATSTSGIAIANADTKFDESLPANVVDYEKRRDVIVTFNAGTTPNYCTIPKDAVVGICHAYIGTYRSDRKVDNKNYDAVIVRCAMEPRSFTDTTGIRTFYGFSEYLDVMSYIPTYAPILSTSPQNSTIGKDSYTFGLNGGYMTAAVTGSVNIDHDYCEVRNLSSIKDNVFDVEYDYKPSFFSSSGRNNALFLLTEQYCVCEWTTVAISYGIDIRIYAKFGHASAQRSSSYFTGNSYNYSYFHPRFSN